jgi:tetratricopeptide (TPR) repeat protein
MDRAVLLARCAEAAYMAGNQAEAAELIRQAIARVDQAWQPLRAGLLHEQLARCLRLLGDPAALGEHQEAVRLVPPGPSVERARVLGSLAYLLVLVDRFADARGPAEEAVAIATQVGARAEEANARTALGGALIGLGDPDAGLAELAAAERGCGCAGPRRPRRSATGPWSSGTPRADSLPAAGRHNGLPPRMRPTPGRRAGRSLRAW